MVNGGAPAPLQPVRVELPGHAGGGVAVLDAQLSPRAVAVGVDRSLRHPQFAGDLLGREMLVDQAQAFTLTRREQPDSVFKCRIARRHQAHSKR
jgi:hypothetical protein